MSDHRIQFSDRHGWEDVAPGVRCRRAKNGIVQLRLVEMLSTAVHPEWCPVGHAGCVLEGILEVEFGSGSVRFSAGDGIVIPPGTAHQHRPRALSDRVRLALVDYPDL
jgi:mannose-6-phosphate isomerase-like protein (cupin superfamily)